MDNATITGLSGTVLGSALTFLGNNVIRKLQGPKIRIDIHDVFLKTDYMWIKDFEEKKLELSLNENTLFKVPKQIRNKFEEFEYAALPLRHYSTVIEYMRFLINEKRRIEIIELLYQEIPSTLQELEMNLNTDMMNSFYENWYKIQDILWSRFMQCYYDGNLLDLDISDYVKFLIGEDDIANRGGETETDTPLPDTEDIDVDTVQKLERLKKLKHGKDCFFFNHANKVIKFNFDPEEEPLANFARNLIISLLIQDKTNLSIIINFLRSFKWKDPNFKLIKETIYNELSGFRKIIVKGMFVNSGGNPIAIKGKGEFIVKSKGFKFHNNGKVIEINDDISIPIHIVSDNKIDIESAVIIKAGQAVPFTAQSFKYFRELNDDTSLKLQALYNMERDCLVKFFRLDKESKVDSNVIKYRDFNENEIV